MLKSRKQGLTIVHADALSFVSYAGDNLQVDLTIPLDAFLAEEYDPETIPTRILNRNNRILIVPDYWLGQTNLKLQSQKRSLVEPFIERNLSAEHSDLAEIALFYNYNFRADSSEDTNIAAFFLLEPTSYQLYHRLESLNIAPIDITSPAYVWEKKLRKMHPESASSGVGLVQKLSSEAYLYFYFKGQFLFSRSIQFTDSPGDASEVLNALTYEINQSVYLFSQKKKADLAYIFMQSAQEDDAVALSESLAREVQTLEMGDNDTDMTPESVETLGPCSTFTPSDLASSKKFLTISQKLWARAREWRPVQFAGVLVGLLLFLLLGGAHFFLVKWSAQIPAMEKTGMVTGQSSREVIQQYNESLDLILAEARRPSARKTMINIASCLPENIIIKQLSLDIVEKSAVSLKCIVRAQGMAQFRRSLSGLLENLASTFIGSPRLEMRDVELGEILPGENFTEYPIQFEIRL